LISLPASLTLLQEVFLQFFPTKFAARHPTHAAPPTFVAIDFETADYGRDSACALALVRVEAGVIVQRAFHYIRPPRARMVFTCEQGRQVALPAARGGL